MTFTAAQIEQLLHPINPARVLRDGKGKAHVSQQDVTAHLIRVFGFGGFDTELLSTDLIFEHARDANNTKFDVCYRATMRLTVRDPEGNEVCHFENGSTATAQNQTRGDAHDLAFKSAISLAKKRCAIDLGDQFGLSLYNKGQMTALVRGTLVHPGKDDAPEGDMQEGVPQQVSLGNDETEPDDPAQSPQPSGPAPKSSADVARAALGMSTPPPERDAVDAKAADIRKGIEQAATKDELKALWMAAGELTPDYTTDLRARAEAKVADLDALAAAEQAQAEDNLQTVLDAEIIPEAAA